MLAFFLEFEKLDENDGRIQKDDSRYIHTFGEGY
jgi:hypothetical protein